MNVGPISGHGLDELEQTIASGLTQFLEVGNALLEIQAHRLYQEDGYQTFEQYCAKRWSISRSQAYRMIQAAEVATHLAADPQLPMPVHEAQTRVLARLKEPAAIRAVWEEVVDEWSETAPAPKVRDAADYYAALQAHPHRAAWPRSEVIAAYREEQKRGLAPPPAERSGDGAPRTMDGAAPAPSVPDDAAAPALSVRDVQFRRSAARQLLALEPAEWTSLLDAVAVSEFDALIGELRRWCDRMDAALHGEASG